MLSWLISSSIRMRALVLALCGVLLVVGFRSVRKAPLDVFPEFAPPIVEVQIEAPGLAAEDVEALVTTPIERGLGGLPGVAALRSSSALGLGVVTVVFAYGTDPYKARQLVIERVAL